MNRLDRRIRLREEYEALGQEIEYHLLLLVHTKQVVYMYRDCYWYVPSEVLIGGPVRSRMKYVDLRCYHDFFS